MIYIYRLIILLSVLFNQRSRRVMFVLCSYATIRQKGLLQDYTQEQLNQQFKLVTEPETMDFPVTVASLIWHDDVSNALTELVQHRAKNISKCIDQIIDRYPKPLRYPRKQMANDLYMLAYRH